MAPDLLAHRRPGCTPRRNRLFCRLGEVAEPDGPPVRVQLRPFFEIRRCAPSGDRWVESTSLQRRVSTKYLQFELALPAFRAWRGAPELIPFAVAIARSALAAKAGPG